MLQELGTKMFLSQLKKEQSHFRLLLRLVCLTAIGFTGLVGLVGGLVGGMVGLICFVRQGAPQLCDLGMVQRFLVSAVLGLLGLDQVSAGPEQLSVTVLKHTNMTVCSSVSCCNVAWIQR